jgi:hypothetical protein
MPHKAETIWPALPPEYHREGTHPVDMAVAFIGNQKSAIGRLTRAFTNASDAAARMQGSSPTDEITQSIKELWLQKEEIEQKLAILTLDKVDTDTALAKLQKHSAENTKRIELLRQFATTVRSLTGHTVPVSTLVEIAEDVLSKTA